MLNNYLQTVNSFYAIVLVLIGTLGMGSTAMAQCTDPSINLPDDSQDVENPSSSYCVNIPINPAITGDPVGFSLELEHTWIGDLSIRVNACGETLMLMTRPGGGSCDAGSPFGFFDDVNGFFTFSEGGGPNPDNGIAFGGGDYGLSGDPCGVNTVNSFAELAAACGGGAYTIEFCITDHALANIGFAGSIAPIFPGVPPTVCGCTNPLATNYDPSANFDDGSCILPCIPPPPPTATASPAVICQGESTSLSAAPCAGGTIRWYTSPSGGSPIAAGPVYNTPALNASTTYYVACDIGDCVSDRSPVTVQITQPATPALIPIGPFCQGAPPALLSNVQDGILGTWSGQGVNNGFFTPSFVGLFNLTFTPASSECAVPAVLVVEVTPNPVPGIVGPETICGGDPAFLTATGDFASYLWNTGGTSQVIPIFSSGTYSVIVTTQPGNCIGEASFTVDESPAPVPVISGNTLICPGESTTLSVDGAYDSYEWSDGSTGAALTVDMPTDVEVTVTNEAGCEGTATVSVEQIDLPDPQLSGPANLCPDVPGTLTITNSSDYDSFSWSTTDDTEEITIPGPGTYSVTVANQGCEAQATFTVNEDSAFPPAISGMLTFCEGDSTELSIVPDYDTYSWSTGGSNATEVVNNTGNVSVTVTDANGCTEAASADISENALPNVQLMGDEEICTGEMGSISVVDGGNFSNIVWNTTDTGPDLVVSGSGTYSVTATDNNGCAGTASFEVEEASLPSAAISGMASFCTGTATVLTAAPAGMSYEWSTGATTQVATIGAQGEVFVTVTNASGCEGVASIEVTEVTELAPEITGPNTLCEGESVFLMGSAGFSAYQWSDNSENAVLEVTTGGTYSLTVTDANGCMGNTSVTVTENALPDAMITGELSYCEGSATSLSGPAGMDGYTWSDNTSGPTLGVNAPGTYDLTVTDANGCENSSSATVVEHPLPLPEITGDFVFCADTSAVLGLANTYESYAWSDGSTAPELTVEETSAVAVTVTDANGCLNSATVDIEEQALPTFNITGPQAFCEGESVTLGVDGAFDAYEWSTGASSDTLVVAEPGTIAVTVTDSNGCSSSDSTALLENQLPAVEIMGALSYCAGDSTVLTATAGSSTYLWGNGDTTQSVTAVLPGDYSLTVTDGNNCTASTAVTVTEAAVPAPEIQGTAAFCPDSTVTLSLDQPYETYQWSTGAVSASVEVSTAEMITVEVTNEAGCTGSDTLETQVFPAPQVAILGSTAFCSGDTVALSADGTFPAYDWSTGAGASEINVNMPGSYSLTVTDANGCLAAAAIEVAENALPEPEITGQNTFCAGDSAVLEATNGFETYLWSDGTTTTTLTVTAPGTQQVTVTDANGCTASTAVTVTETALPVPEIQGTAAFCPDSTVTLSLDQPYETYQWSTGAVSASVEVSTAEMIAVEVTNEAGCTGSDTLETQVFPAPQVAILGSTAFCAGDTVALSADGAFPAYDWSTGAGASEINVNMPGSYSLTVTDANGCLAAAAIEVAENALPEPEITGQDFFCAGDSTTLEATAGFESYLWNNGTTMASQVVTTPGTAGVTVTDVNGCQGATAFFVDEVALPAPQINGVPEFCPGTSTTLSASAIFSSYDWSNGDTTGTTTVTAPGNVTLTVTNAQGCVGSAAVETNEYSTQTPQIDGVPNFCPGTSTILTAEDGFTAYQWSNNTATPAVEVTAPGTIAVTVTDSNDCITSNSIEVGVYNVLAPDIEGPDGFCTDTTATLSAGAGYAVYEWSNGSGAQSITIDSGGVYRVTVTDTNGCITEDNYQLQEFNLPDVAIGGSSSFCPGGSATLNAGADYAAYAWSNGSNSPSISVDQEGLYELTVTDTNGCTNAAGLQVVEQEELSPVISGPLQFCPGTETQLSAGTGYTIYEWQDGAETAAIAVTEPGSYSVYVEDASGCSGSATVQVSLFPEAEVEISGPEGFCTDESATLTAGGPSLSSFKWENGSFDPVRMVSQPGDYTVFATDINGCRDTAEYNIITYPLPAFEIEATPYFCAGASTTLQASATYPSYTWNGTPGADTLEVSTAGLYVLEVADSNGCQNQANIEVDNIPLPMADAGIPDTLTCTVNEVALGGNGTSTGPAFTYQWMGPDITAQTASLPSPVVGTAGTYELLVTDTVHNCISEPATAEVPLSNDVPVISLSVNDTLDCATASLVIDGSASSAWPELMYQWEDLSGTVLATNTNQLSTDSPGLYVLLLEDVETGCSERDTVQIIQDIEIPEAEAGPAQRLDCALTSVALSASSSTQGADIQYTWLDEDQVALASADSVMVNAPGTYTLVVTNTRNSCQNEDEVVITQDIEPPVADAGQPQQIDCLNPTANLDGTASQTGPDITHQWAFGAQSNVIGSDLSITADTAGTYFLIVTNQDNQCQSVATVEVAEIATAPTAIRTAANGPACFGDGNGSILVSSVEGGTSPYLYSINGGPFDQQAAFADLSGGVYSLIVQDAIGCEYETEIVLEEGNDLGVTIIEQDENGQIKVGLGEEVKLTAEINVSEDEIARYLWQAADSLSCYDCQVTYVTPSASGLYQVQITDANGCTATDQVQLILNKKRRVYLPNAFSPNGDGANDVFYVQTGPEVVKVQAFEIYNRWGEPVFTVFNAPPNDPLYGWDGYHRGELMNGAVFTWFTKVEYVDGAVELFQGDVLLMR